MKKFNEAIDQIRRGEVKLFKAENQENVLLNGRWLLLKRPENLNEIVISFAPASNALATAS